MNYTNDFKFILLPLGSKVSELATIKPSNRNAPFSRATSSTRYLSNYQIDEVANNVGKISYNQNNVLNLTSEIDVIQGIGNSNDLLTNSTLTGLNMVLDGPVYAILGNKSYSMDVTAIDECSFTKNFTDLDVSTRTMSIYAAIDNFDYVYYAVLEDDNVVNAIIVNLNNGNIEEQTGTGATVTLQSTSSYRLTLPVLSGTKFIVTPLDDLVDINNPFPTTPAIDTIFFGLPTLNSGTTPYQYTPTNTDNAITTRMFTTTDVVYTCPSITFEPGRINDGGAVNLIGITNTGTIASTPLGSGNSDVYTFINDGVYKLRGFSKSFQIASANANYLSLSDADGATEQADLTCVSLTMQALNGGAYVDNYFNNINTTGKATADSIRRGKFQSTGSVVEFSVIVNPLTLENVKIVYANSYVTNTLLDYDSYDNSTLATYDFITKKIGYGNGKVNMNVETLLNGFLKIDVVAFNYKYQAGKVVCLFQNNESFVEIGDDDFKLNHFSTQLSIFNSPYSYYTSNNTADDKLDIDNCIANNYLLDNRGTIFFDIRYIKGVQDNAILFKNQSGSVNMAFNLIGNALQITDLNGIVIATINKHENIKLAITYNNGAVIISEGGSTLVTLNTTISIDRIENSLVSCSYQLMNLMIDNENKTEFYLNGLTV